MVGIRPFTTSRHESKYKSVNQYNHSSALLHLFHNFPSKSPRYVQVDITQLLDTVDHQHLQAGAWLNIIGYVTTASLTTKSKVQAIMLWSAGPIHLQQYEDALLARQMT
jgi:hypothetical protein